MLVLTEITKTFFPGEVNEKIALEDLSLHLKKGDFTTVIGGNGAGKSTMLNCIAGVHQPEKGSVLLNKNNVSGLPEHKRAAHIARVFQDPMLGTAAGMTIEENMSLALKRGCPRTLKKAIRKSNRDFFRERLSILNLGLEDRLTTRAGLLSGGQRQALSLVMATLRDPDLLLLDEHTAALDPGTEQTVMEITDWLVKKLNLTALMVTHNMEQAVNHGNRMIMMDRGKIIMDVQGDEKKNLTSMDLIDIFARKSSGGASDRMVLADWAGTG